MLRVNLPLKFPLTLCIEECRFPRNGRSRTEDMCIFLIYIPPPSSPFPLPVSHPHSSPPTQALADASSGLMQPQLLHSLHDFSSLIWGKLPESLLHHYLLSSFEISLPSAVKLWLFSHQKLNIEMCVLYSSQRDVSNWCRRERAHVLGGLWAVTVWLFPKFSFPFFLWMSLVIQHAYCMMDTPFEWLSIINTKWMITMLLKFRLYMNFPTMFWSIIFICCIIFSFGQPFPHCIN